MAEQARVTDIAALEAFHTSLILYLDKAKRVLDEIADDVSRTRLWIENDRRMYWQNQVKQRRFQLEQKQAELFSAKLSGLRDVTPMEHAAVREAKRAVEEAEAKGMLTRQWGRDYDNRVVVPAKELEKFRSILELDMGRALAFLAQAIKTLDAYATSGAPAQVTPGMSSATSQPPAASTASSSEKGRT
jgi:hypothetical protein